MGGAGGVGTGWEERMGAVSGGCRAPGPQSKPLPVEFWWAADPQALGQ